MRASARLRRTRDVHRVRREGERRGDRYFVVVAARSDAGAARLAVAASREVGGAVRRNRARRRTRAAFAPFLERLAPPRDLLVTAMPAVVDAPFPDLSRSAAALLREQGLLGGAS